MILSNRRILLLFKSGILRLKALEDDGRTSMAAASSEFVRSSAIATRIRSHSHLQGNEVKKRRWAPLVDVTYFDSKEARVIAGIVCDLRRYSRHLTLETG